MAALVQGYPQQSGTVTMLQTRPASASGMLPVQSNAQYAHGGTHRNSIHGLPAGVASPVVYRDGSGSVQPYAYTGSPSLNPTTQWQQVRSHRTSSSPAVPTIQTLEHLQPGVARSRYAASNSMTNLPSTASISLTGAGSRDDSALSSSGTRKAAAVNGTSLSPPLAQAAPARVSPERYRRTAQRSSDSAGSGLGKQPQETAAAGRPGHTRSASDQKPAMLRTAQLHQMNRPNSYIGSVSGSAIDDMGFARGQGQDEPRRTRRRSLPALDSAGFAMPLTPPELKQPELSSRPDRPASAKLADKKTNKAAKAGNNKAGDRNNSSATTDARLGSSDSRSSGRSAASNNSRASSSSANRSANASNPTGNPAPSSSSPSQQTGNSQDYPRLVNIPPRSSSSDAATPKRAVNSSPLSKAMGAETENGVSADAADSAIQEAVKPTTPRVESPAARQLAAINEKGGKPKNKTSRLRRAFSFGSAAEFRKAVHANSEAAENGHGKLQKERSQDQDDAYETEQARIAQRQEEAGIGSNIYAGGRLFSGSTDNLSISSTASSASIMIRKMGRGMKKGGRSLVGLFRPKSIIGVPAADARLPEAMEATVSMINVEAERERVNVNADPRTQAGGGTGFPRLERNSIDAANVPTLEADPRSSTGTDGSAARKSIVGGERERAEVLAAVRKGILKKERNGSGSPSPRGTELPQIPNVTDSPSSSAPSTPNDEQQGHRRTAPVTIGSEDYFVSALRLRQDTKSAPGTPQGSLKRNATFSPRIITFETWPSQEYDRRGDIATCNRLTPMLAQQIKEELNTFKMEMEVHENSKIYTHFF
ncbi:hypothetical protein QBC40DRAFT_39720 [Triangularia verruculosa]|uniref:Protein BNI4 n=1 Tax=Triangularia verruculosa TaxID=2587418 RepID=A0AAN6XS24_9PEZI|nr:hypothetical protein QBC40DRAFT_39720 [Triangularia verruculosa]